MNKIIENNQVTIRGEVFSGFSFSHELYGENFYTMQVKVPRDSGYEDVIPVMVSDRMLDVKQEFIGQWICVEGQFRSYNKQEDRKNKLVLSVFAREVEFIDYLVHSGDDNKIFLDGYICKDPIYRKTPLGREIADILLAVNRPYGKSDYIPCICWGRNAKFAEKLNVGEHCAIHGRIQSRSYMKKLDEEHLEERVAYEVSISTLEVVEETIEQGGQEE